MNLLLAAAEVTRRTRLDRNTFRLLTSAATVQGFNARMFRGILSVLTVAVSSLGGQPHVLWRTNGMQGVIRSVSLSSNTQWLASGGNSGPARLWQTADGQLLNTLPNPWEDHWTRVAISPDGTRLFGGGGEGSLAVWEIPNGLRVFFNPPNGKGVQSIAWSPDGGLFALGRSSANILVAEATNFTGVIVLEGHQEHSTVTSVAFSPDGSLLLSGGSDQTCKLWRLADGAILTNWYGFTGPVAFSPVEPLIALTSVTGTTALVNYTNGALVRLLEGSGTTVNAPQTLDFSPNGRWLGMVNNGVLQFWRVSDGKLMRSYEEPSGALVYCIDIAPNGKWFAYGNSAGEVAVARLPLLMTGLTQHGGRVVLGWEGDTGLYQLQRCTNLNGGMWENVGGPTTRTCVTNDLSQASVFYRVQSLPNP